MSAQPVANPKPRRSATVSLLTIVLALDALLVFFVMMAVFGLHLLPPGVVFGAGITLIVVLAATGRVMSKPWGIWVGHALQLVLISLGVILTPMYIVGAIFAALWVYCFVTGQRLDRRNAALLDNAGFDGSPHDDATLDTDHPTDPTSTTTQE